MWYPQVIIIISDDCSGLVFFWTKISALVLQTHDGKIGITQGSDLFGSHPTGPGSGYYVMLYPTIVSLAKQ